MTFKIVSETPTITAGAYSSLDAVGGKLEFENVCTPYGSSGVIVQAQITDKAKQDALLILTLFDRDFTPTADNAAFAISDADLLNVVAVLQFPVADYVDYANNSIATMGILSAIIQTPFVLVEGGTSLFGQLMVKTSTPTYVTTSDLTVSLTIKT
jgi:hypothetical protein